MSNRGNPTRSIAINNFIKLLKKTRGKETYGPIKSKKSNDRSWVQTDKRFMFWKVRGMFSK